ncbi:MAG: apolipoprotein N-acyltransferase, partial [Flavobacteriales bacterium]
DLQWPWFSLGNAFGTRPRWVQWYEHTGMLGGSLWVLVVNLLVFEALSQRGPARGKAVRLAALAAAALVLPLGASLWRYHTYPLQAEGGVEAVVVQPNIDPYGEKFDGDPLELLERMVAQAEERVTEATRLVVFPETALQEPSGIDGSTGSLRFHGLWENDLEASLSVRRLRAFQGAHPQVALLVGMSSARWFRGEAGRPVMARPIEGTPYWYEAYNAALWMPAQGPLESYHKSKLVAGVELMPFEELLGWLGDFAIDMGGTSGSLGQQRERSVLRDASSGLAVIPAICYESVFGEHLAAHARNGGSLLCVITNDGWWGESPGYRQHLTFSSLRAIELRRDVARAANTGISCVVDQRGDIHRATGWWVPAAFAATVHPNAQLTFFARNGDLVGKAGLGVSCALLLALLLLPLRRRAQ